MMDARNYCPHGGTLVGGREWLPSDPHDFNWGSAYPVIGCNHLRCGDCGAEVRHGLGYSIAPERMRDFAPASVYDSQDWSASPDLRYSPTETSRLYVCRCRYKEEAVNSDLDRPEIDPIRGFISNWRCAGHPPMPASPPPADLDGFVTTALSSKSALVPASMPAQARLRPAFGLSRLYALLAASAASDEAAALAQAVSRQLSADDVTVRRAAVEFFYDHAWAPGAERLAELVRDRRDLFFGHRDPETRKQDLSVRVFRTLIARFGRGRDQARPDDPVLVDVLRAEALRAGGQAQLVVHALAIDDARWLRDHTIDIVTATPAIASTLAFLFSAEPVAWLEATFARIALAPGVDAAALRDSVVQHIAEPARSKVLAALPAP